MRKPITYLLFTAVVLISCRETLDYYLGVPLQPEFIENNFVPGLNIFGILRPDSEYELNQSFIHVQQVIPAIGDTTSTLEIDSAIVFIIEEDNPEREYHFDMRDPDSVLNIKRYVPPTDFNPQPGISYTITCMSDTLPVLSGSTVMPLEPRIYSENGIREGDMLNFIIESDTLAYLYDIYLKVEDYAFQVLRTKPEKNTDTKIQLPLNGIPAGSVIIYAYDENLTSYYITSNISLNFNKYRKPYSTVDNGYGVFGALNYLEVKF